MTIESDLFRSDPAPLIARGLPDLRWVPWGIRVTAQALGDRSHIHLLRKSPLRWHVPFLASVTRAFQGLYVFIGKLRTFKLRIN